MPERSSSMEAVRGQLGRYIENDIRIKDGRLFTYLYDPDLNELKEVGKIYEEFLNRNGMDYHAFPSTLRLENDIVAMVGSLLHGDDGIAGNFTTGGTESIILAVKSARDRFFEKNGDGRKPEIIIPVTAHPAFRKAAEYLGLRIVRIPVDPVSFMVNPSKIEESITQNTAIIVVSAPNFPFGIVDPVEDVGKIAEKHNIWLHVDACVGGMILPFLSQLGVKVKNWDFSVKGVSSISVDLHKYGFTPKGSSVILYRNNDLRRHQLYVNANWPGYPMSNVGIQSTKSAAPLAASWAVMNFLGNEGYLRLARRTLEAKEKLVKGLIEFGYRIVGNDETTILAFTSNNLNVFRVGNELKKRGWYLQVQPGSEKENFPPSLHLNVSPIHDRVYHEFLKDLGEITDNLKATNSGGEENEEIFKSIESVKEGKIKIIDLLKGTDNPSEYQQEILNEIIRLISPNVVESAFKDLVNEDFSPSVDDEFS